MSFLQGMCKYYGDLGLSSMSIPLKKSYSSSLPENFSTFALTLAIVFVFEVIYRSVYNCLGVLEFA